VCFARPFPSFLFISNVSSHIFYFRIAGYYFTGDGAKRDADGYYWITGRVDDVINPSGHRIGE
jgi:acyl-coenzyme A synthetase/AMP-(fatty) acid ligase